MRYVSPIILLSLLLFTACNNGGDIEKADGIAYVNYKITGEEGREMVTCLFQFFSSDTTGKAIKLQEPASVMLDGEKLEVGSAGFSGAYYEAQKPFENFAGRHTILLADRDGRQYKETFDFVPFTLTTEIGETLKKGNINLRLDGLKDNESLKLMLVDTSFTSMDIDREQPVTGGMLQLTKKDFEKVAAGPVTLYLIKEEERRVKNGGKITISYQVTREFDLVN